MIVAIVGAGNAGCAYAWHLAKAGHQVRLLKTSQSLHEDNFAEIVRCGGIWGIDEAFGDGREFAPLELATRDEVDALQGADVAIILIQSLFHRALAERLGPLLQGLQLVLVVPGNMGSLYFRNSCPSRDVVFAEGESSAIDARIEKPGTIRILFRNVRNPLAMLPATRSREGLEVAGRLFETYQDTRADIVESALHNPNLMLHPIGMILSASAVEHREGGFSMYSHAFTPSVWNVVEALDAEKKKVLQAFGHEPIAYVEACKFRNEADLSTDAIKVFQGYQSCAPKGPTSLSTRYIDEDVPMGLCLMSSLGQLSGRATPVCDSLVNLAGALRQRDFWESGRSLTELGLAGMTVSQISHMIRGE